jgi:hypothetical protein
MQCGYYYYPIRIDIQYDMRDTKRRNDKRTNSSGNLFVRMMEKCMVVFEDSEERTNGTVRTSPNARLQVPSGSHQNPMPTRTIFTLKKLLSLFFEFGHFFRNEEKDIVFASSLIFILLYCNKVKKE